MSTKKHPAKRASHSNVHKVHSAEKAGADITRKAAASVESFYGLKPIKGVENIMTENKAKFEKLSQDAAATGKEHFEAFGRAGNIFARGLEDYLKTCAALAQGAAERNAQAFKALLSSKTLNEFTELQSAVVQQNFDDFLTSVTKLSELGVKVATETLEPLNDQVSKTFRKTSDSLAA